ncbi:MAG: hypothetical protein Tsb0033_14810 [Winogradskyella sp.]
MLRSRIIYSILFISFVHILYAESGIEEILYNCHSGSYEKSREKITSLTDSYLFEQYTNYLNIYEFGDFSNIDLNEVLANDTTTHYRIILNVNKALKYYLVKGDEFNAYKLLKDGLSLSERIDNKILICLTSRLLLEIYSRSIFTIKDKSYSYVLKNYLENAYNSFEQNTAHLYGFKITMRIFYGDSVALIKRKYKALHNQFKNELNNLSRAKFYISNSIYHNRITNDIDSSFFI